MPEPQDEPKEAQRGRPRSNQETVVVSVRVPEPVYRDLSRSAADRGQTVSDLLRARLLR
jgi:hypothetical protein